MHFVHAGPDPDRPQPSREQLQAVSRRMNRPDNEVPGAIAVNSVVGRTDQLVVAVVAAAAYSTGISITVAIRLRHSETSARGLGGELFGHRRGASGDALLIGVAYPDGRTASNVNNQHFPDPFAVDDRPALVPGGGGGGERSYDITYWLTPLPPPGDLTVIVAWPARGLPESRVVIPADAIAHGVARGVELWPWSEPDDDDPPAGPPKPVLPAGGWFAEHVSDDPETP